VRVVEYDPSRRGDVAVLMERVWGNRPPEEALAWFYERSPVRAASVLLGEEDGKTAGSVAMSFLRMSVGGEELEVGMPVRLATDPDFQGRGIFRELESAMSGAERAGDLELASALAEEISRLEPEVIKHQQKRVEYAFRTNDRPRLIEAYLALADVLLRTEQIDKARTIYERVLDLSPDELRARAGLQTVGANTTPASVSPLFSQRLSGAMPAPRNSRPVRREITPVAGGFVNLGDLLRDEEAPRDTRMIVPEQEPTGDEEADFADMLRKFKQGIAENVDPEDYQAHYDLAIAYKEMGLIDEAIGEFQKALGSSTNRLPSYEALGQCFMDKGQFKLASSILTRALNERASDEQLVGVLYLLGRTAEALGNNQDALSYYQRVFVVDIQFRDITERMNEVERAWR